MHSSDNFKDLPPREWERLESLVSRFERAWQEGEAVDLRHFLPPEGDPLRLRALKELVLSEMEIRWRRGQRALFDEYLRRFPELNQQPDLHATLIAAEYQVRRRHGDKPSLSAYAERFPALFTAIEKLVRDAQPPAPPENEQKSIAPRPPAAAQGHVPVGGGYHLIERLGRGEFGVVWRALAPGGVEVAIKIIHRPVETVLAQRELEALNIIKLLRHPFLLQTQGFWTWEDKLIIAMQLADCSLGDRLKRCIDAGGCGIPMDELRTYMHEACEALDFLHSKQVLHRDIKPANILLMQGHAMLADFGVARMLQPDRTAEATLVGTPLYIAPEVWRGRVEARSDQYSLAATYFELRTNRPIFPGHAIVELMSDHTQRLPELDPLPQAEKDVLLRALSKDPTKRFESCMEFFRALDQALGMRAAGSREQEAGIRNQESGVRGQDSGVRKQGLGGDAFGSLLPAASVATPPPASAESESEHLAAPARRTEVDPQVRETIRTGKDALSIASSSSGKAATVKEPGWRRDKATVIRPRRSLLAPAVVVLALVVCVALVVWWQNWHGGRGTDVGAGRRTSRAAEVDFLPQGCVRGDGADIVSVRGKKIYNRIVFPLGEKAARAEFVLVPNAGGDGDPPALYMLRTKVSNELFRAFAEGRKLESPWTRGASKAGRELGVENDSRQFPVFNVTWDDADAFGQWLGERLSAKVALPTARQWDYAAGQGHEPASGHYDGAPGPFQGDFSSSGEKCAPPAFALGNQGPLPVGAATHDRTNSGLSDMASNGFEWTRTKCDENDQENGPVDASVRTDDWISVRGATYNQSRPYVYGPPKLFRRFKPRPDLSFRVVIEVP